MKLQLRIVRWLALGLLLAAPVAFAAKTLDELRSAGTLGERWDGFAELRAKDAPAEVKDQVAEINRKRREVYGKRAAEEKVALEAVGRIYAKEIREKAPSGTWFLLEDGRWEQKK